MRFRVLSLVLGAVVASTMGLQAPSLAANYAANNPSTHTPSNRPNASVPSNINKAMGHIKSAYSSAAKAHADVVEGKFADASKDIKSARDDLDKASKVKHLPASMQRTIGHLVAALPPVERSIKNQQASAKTRTRDYVTAMNRDINNLTLATTSPVGGGAGPNKKTTGTNNKATPKTPSGATR